MGLSQEAPAVAPPEVGDAAEAAPAPPPGEATAPVGLAVVAVAAGVVLRFWCLSELWLDEALTVNIARLPLSELPDALRNDGAPPLFYVLLHGWTAVFGTGDLAVRALPGALGVASLPLAWMVGCRFAGRKAGAALLLLVASSPFAVRYSTEARMYALVVFLTLLGHLALMAALEQPSALRLAAVASVTGLMLLTHYWSFYLVAAVSAALAVRMRRGEPHAPRRCLLAMGAGSLLFVPWVPVFAHQLVHTGTPWGSPPTFGVVVDTIEEFAGRSSAGAWLAVVFVLLAALGTVGRAAAGRRIVLDLSKPGPAAPVAGVAAGTMVLALAVGMALGAAFAGRYASVVLVPFLLVVAVGTTAFADDRLRRGVLTGVVALGLVASAPNVGDDRTQAEEVAAAIERLGRPGDVVAYCPDQLGPSVSRVLRADGVLQVTFPDERPPYLVDWSDYAERARARSPVDFAEALLARAGPDRTVFVVASSAYRVVGRRCQAVVAALADSRTQTVHVKRERGVFEPMTLSGFAPGP